MRRSIEADIASVGVDVPELAVGRRRIACDNAIVGVSSVDNEVDIIVGNESVTYQLVSVYGVLARVYEVGFFGVDGIAGGA
jgi:hypothetical protein